MLTAKRSVLKGEKLQKFIKPKRILLSSHFTVSFHYIKLEKTSICNMKQLLSQKNFWQWDVILDY
jgi:hypothetical protein